MNIRHLSSLAFLAIIVMATTPAHGESSNSLEKTFFCQTKNNTLTTFAKNENGQVLPIFYWYEKALPTEIKSQKTCDEVAEKLEKFLVPTDNLHTISFQSINLENIPVICLSKNINNCDLVLFTLIPNDKPIETANQVLESILNPKLQKNKVISSERGVQSTAYSVSLWQLLDFTVGDLINNNQ